MTEVALALYLLFLLLAFAWRTWLQRRRTGSSGFHGISGRPGSAEWTGGILFVVAIALGLAAPVLALAGVVDPIDDLERPAVQWLGLVLACVGIAATLASQMSMGASWRIGVDPAETTALITDGAFSIVRNPIFAAMLPFALGLALIVPSVVALAAVIALVMAVELQVRVVEEPYLLRAHADTYRGYAQRVGRFLPGIGRLSG